MKISSHIKTALNKSLLLAHSFGHINTHFTSKILKSECTGQSLELSLD